jgi:hypothetical protein
MERVMAASTVPARLGRQVSPTVHGLVVVRTPVCPPDDAVATAVDVVGLP